MLKRKLKTWLPLLLIVSLSGLNLRSAGAYPNTAISDPITVQVGGLIDVDTTWVVASSPYLVSQDVVIGQAATLTIKPGVTVKFESGTSLVVNGGLVARGTTLNPVIFTSNQAEPAPGDWGNIEFTSTAITTTLDAYGKYQTGSVLQYCQVEFAGQGKESAIQAHSLLIDSCTIRNNASGGISMTGTETGPGFITNNTISDNVKTMYNGGGVYTSYTTISGNTLQANRALSGFGGGIWATNSTLKNNLISENSANLGGGMYAVDSQVSDNKILNNTALEGGGAAVVDSLVSGNILYANSAGKSGGGIFAITSSLAGNTISANNAQQSAAGGELDGGEFLKNTVVGNNVIQSTGPAGLQLSGEPQVHANTFFDNMPYDVSVETSIDISGTLNYWGSYSLAQIAARILDGADEEARGHFLYEPIGLEPSQDAPIAPPTNLKLTIQADQAHLTWNGLPYYAGLWSYKLYYDNDGLLPYEGSDLSSGSSPLEAGTQNSITLDNLDPNREYYFALTVYRPEGLESWYSNQVKRGLIYSLHLPFISR